MKTKRWLSFSVLVAILLLAAPCFSQGTGVVTMHNKNSVVLAWDAVSLPTGVTTGQIRYQVYTKNDLAATTGTAIGQPVTALNFTIATFTPYVPYYFGVEAQYWADGSNTPTDKSTVAWSTDAAACSQEGTFGNLFKSTLGAPKGLNLR